jgi:hypothetical protein
MFLLRPSSAHAGWPDLSKLTPALAPGPAAAARQSGALGLDRVAGCFIAREGYDRRVRPVDAARMAASPNTLASQFRRMCPGLPP